MEKTLKITRLERFHSDDRWTFEAKFLQKSHRNSSNGWLSFSIFRTQTTKNRLISSDSFLPALCIRSDLSSQHFSIWVNRPYPFFFGVWSNVNTAVKLQSQLHTAAFQGEYHEFVIITRFKFPRLRTHPSVHLKSTENANMLLVFQSARLHLLQKPINLVHYLATLWRFKDWGSSSIRFGVLLTNSDKTSTNCFTDNAIQSSTEK